VVDANAGAATTSTLTIASGGSFHVKGSTAGAASTTPNSIIGQQSGTGVVNVGATDKSTSGTFTVDAGTGLLIGNSGGNGTLNVNSGTATINRGSIATTTTFTDTRLIMMGKDNASSTGTINLNGGTLATGRQFVRDGSTAAGSGTANFVFNGGTLQALGTQTDWLQSTTASSAGQNQGATGGTVNTAALALSSVTTTAVSTIDSNGFSVAINNNISGVGGFNIASTSGTGTVTLGGTNTFSGVTKVNSGTLALGNVNALQKSPLDVTGAGAVTFTVAGTNTYTLGGLQNSAGTGTVGATLAAGANSITLGSTATSAITVANLGDFNSAAAIAVTTSGAFTLGGTLNVTFANTFANGSSATFNLFDGNTAGSFTSVSVQGSYTATLNAGNSYSFTDVNGNTFSFNNTIGTLSFTAVPEPHAVAFAIVALLGVVVFVRRRALQQD
jgi:autotransporter-associated beta strand protein